VIAMDKIKVLIVDDEIRLCKLLKKGLETLNEAYSIETAFSGIEALNILKSEKYHVLITDIRMPVIDGFELLNRADSIQNNLKKIVMTGHLNYEKEISDKLDVSGDVDFFPKPVSFYRLHQSISDGLKLEGDFAAA